MKYKRSGYKWIIRLEKGDEIVGSIKKFCKDNNIENAFFSGIGAVSYLELGAYKLAEKKYISREYNEEMEICSISGNVAKLEADLIIHCHGIFSNHDMECVGGHLNKAYVSATCEIILSQIDTDIERKLDETIGLNLMDI